MRSKSLREHGQALVIIALAAIGLVGMVGLAIDGSAKFSDRRHAQNAADTAAMAGALTKTNKLAANETEHPCSTASGFYNDPSFCLPIIYAAWDRAEENGYDGSLPDSVDVYSPPISGPYLNNASYVQVIITSYVDTYLSRIVGINQTKNTVEAVAYLYEGGILGDGAMIISYDPDPTCSEGEGAGGGSVDVSGGATVNLSGGGIFVNSDEVCAFKQANCTASALNITGGAGINSVASIDNISQCAGGDEIENLNQDPVVIPDDVYFPPEPPECNQTAIAYPLPAGQNEIWHITPGYYTDFPQYNINGDKIIGNKKTIIMDPGVYCVGGDIRWSGSTFDSLDGSSGVTLYIKSGYDFHINIDSPITLYAPDSGDYQGYLIIQQGTHTNIKDCIINGGTYLDLLGSIYAPYCDITVNGGGDEFAEINAQIIGWDLKINGTNIVTFHYDPDHTPVLNRRVGLMR